MRTFALPTLLVLSIAGCTPPKETDSGSSLTKPSDSDADTDTDSDSDTDVGDYLEVAAIGFAVRGVYDQENPTTLGGFLFDDGNGGIGYSYPYVVVKLATADYFGMSSDDPGYEDEYCSFIAGYSHVASDGSGEEFDYDAGKGGTGGKLETWGAYDGSLFIVADSMTDNCYNLDPAVFDGGDPINYMDGMRFGVAVGPLSPFLETTFSDNTTFSDIQDSYLTQFIAINHEDGYHYYDWSAALLVDTDFTECKTIDNGTGATDEICGLLQVDGDQYVLADATQSPIHDYMTGFSYWFEDLPNLDLTILKDGAPQ